MWLFFGSKSLPADERPPIPLVPELEDPNWRAVYGRFGEVCGQRLYGMRGSCLHPYAGSAMNDGAGSDVRLQMIRKGRVVLSTDGLAAGYGRTRKWVNFRLECS